MKTKITLLCIYLVCSLQLLAIHNRAGEIVYEQIGPLTVIAKVKTYTKASSRPADRDSLEICWGDGLCQWAIRSNGTDTDGNGIPEGELLGNDVKLNIYTIQHTYQGTGQYTISMTDPNRNAGILNVNFPSSIQIPFFLSTELQLAYSPNQTNHSPIPTMPPIDNGLVGLPFFHTPNAYDPDGDSLAYELITPLQAESLAVPNYKFPNEIEPGPENNISLDPLTGLFTWNSPQQSGEYNIAILIKEYRNGELIGQMVRDMQFYIGPGGNFQLPTFEDPQSKVIAQTNETLEVTFRTNSTQPVWLFAYGEPLLINPIASFQTDTTYAAIGKASGTIFWQPTPDITRELPYRIVIKSETSDKVISVHLVEIFVDDLVNIKPGMSQSPFLLTFPNPSDQYLRLNLEGYNLKAKGNIRLFNSEGKILLEKLVIPGETQWDLSMAHLAKGIYYLSLTSEDLILETKVIKH